jgi:hypothetical protein
MAQDARVLLLGESVTLTMSSVALCAGVRRHVETIVVVDRSGTGSSPMQPDPSAVLALALAGRRTDVPIAVVLHGQGRVVGHCPFELSEAGRFDCLAAPPWGGATNWGAALDRARELLESELDPERVDLGLQDVRFVLLAGGALDPEDCESARSAYSRLASLGAHVITACTGPDCNRGCLSSWASSSAADCGIVDSASLTDLLSTRRHWGWLATQISKLELQFGIPDAVRVESITSDIDVRIARQGSQVRATFAQVPREGVTLTLHLSPRRPGYHRLVDGGVTVTVDDSLGGRHVGGPSSQLHWRTPGVLVLEPRELPADFGSKRLYLPLLVRP